MFKREIYLFIFYYNLFLIFNTVVQAGTGIQAVVKNNNTIRTWPGKENQSRYQLKIYSGSKSCFVPLL